MLCRIVSELWQKDEDNKDKPIFIERDGHRFRYVLDYMRDGKATLSVGKESVSKQSLLEELTYFGFQDVNPKSITVDIPVCDISKCVDGMAEDFKAKHATKILQRDQLNLEIACMAVAHACAAQRLSHGGDEADLSGNELHFDIRDPDNNQEPKPWSQWSHSSCLDFQVVEAVQQTSLQGHQEMLNTFLAQYGLRAFNYSERTEYILDTRAEYTLEKQTERLKVVSVSVIVFSTTD
ncbi:MAG: hypothetical protein SGARI_003626 [Bacillariaceae sp.]